MNTNNQQTNALAVQPAAQLPVSSVRDLQTLGAIIAQCNLFGKRNPAEGLAIVAMCQQKRISWLDFMQNFHMIQGVVTKRTDAMIADFHRIGGKHTIITRTSEEAKAVFVLGETKCESSISWAECQCEPFIYVGKEAEVVAALERGETPPMKAKYKTPRARMQMLWARCVSDGVRAVAPECCCGIYTPEEASDFIEAERTQETGPASITDVIDIPASEDQNANIEVCPVGIFAGKRWDSMETGVLAKAVNGSSPLITVKMKDYIREILASREGAAGAEASPVREAARKARESAEAVSEPEPEVIHV